MHAYTFVAIIFRRRGINRAFSHNLNKSFTVVRFALFPMPCGVSQFVFVILSPDAYSFISLRKYFTNEPCQSNSKLLIRVLCFSV